MLPTGGNPHGKFVNIFTIGKTFLVVFNELVLFDNLFVMYKVENLLQHQAKILQLVM